ncbi:glycosyltransferase family 2 protein [Salinimonas chungwhensis]|uniref:glycosyltransferase family 2 protein n=1 Tax=Salinimonas chungwhensis TaxID=265425 RepID=UPI000380767D|nr:glycosyltransferase family 2 protein [Salinimonas chungwhensis]
MISVVICTYNREKALTKCLNSFLAVAFTEAWELIIVDNNSTDNTKNVIEAFSSEGKLPIKSVLEKKKGLGNARNKGIATASYEIVAFTDDDCYPQPDYLTQLYNAFTNENIDFLGGRVLLYNKKDLGWTIQLNEREKYFESNSLIKPGEIHGANFAFKKSVLTKAKGFDPLFGAGAYFPCEDVDSLAECLWVGGRGKYCPAVVVSHDHGRRTEADKNELIESYSIGRGAFFTKRILFKKRQRFIYAKCWFFFIRNQSVRETWIEVKSSANYLKIKTFGK